MTTCWFKPTFTREDRNPETGELRPDAMRAGIYCKDEATYEEIRLASIGKGVTVSYHFDGDVSIGGMQVYVATPEQAEALERGQAVDPMLFPVAPDPEPVRDPVDAFGAHITEGTLGRIGGREIGPGHVVLFEDRYRWLFERAGLPIDNLPEAVDPASYYAEQRAETEAAAAEFARLMGRLEAMADPYVSVAAENLHRTIVGDGPINPEPTPWRDLILTDMGSRYAETWAGLHLAAPTPKKRAKPSNKPPVPGANRAQRRADAAMKRRQA